MMETFEDWIKSWRFPLLMAGMGEYAMGGWLDGTYHYLLPDRKAFFDGVTAVYADAEGVNGGPGWLAVVEFSDGHFGFVSAKCDNTGWGCCADGDIVYSSSLEEVKSDLVLTDEARERLVWRDPPLRRETT